MSQKVSFKTRLFFDLKMFIFLENVFTNAGCKISGFRPSENGGDHIKRAASPSVDLNLQARA